MRAVDGVSFSVERGETLGVVGESGCGKSTMARCIMRLLDPTGGRVIFDGRDITNIKGGELLKVRRELMMVFQDPYASLNVRKRVGSIIGEALEVHKIGTPKENKARVQELLDVVGLNPEHYNRFPHEFSGGQRQRIGVARALADPAEADRLRRARVGARRVGAGADPEPAEAASARLRPDVRLHRPRPRRRAPHLRQRRRHVPGQDRRDGAGARRSTSARGTPTRARCSRPCRSRTPTSRVPASRSCSRATCPSPINPPSGCRFHPRCPRFQQGVCDVDEPELEPKDTGSRAACHFPLETWPMTDLRLPADQVAAGT